jgi:uncharacterized repeat protein (TIGR03803 family)
MKLTRSFRARRLFRAANFALAAAAIILTLATPALTQTEKVLYSFVPSSGQNPVGSLIFDSAGNLYGATNSVRSAQGTVFELSPSGADWNQTVLIDFFHTQDGANPRAGLISDAAGNLYGTTEAGGHCCGVAFELSPLSGGGWKETVLHSFGGADGDSPQAGLILDSSGNLYGTTELGGNLDCANSGCGVVFKLSPSSAGWKETVLHTFSGHADGSYPLSPLLLDSSGNLYGTTADGGDVHVCSGGGCGVAFELSPLSGGGWKETVLHTFTGGLDGANPITGLIRDSAGNLYGTTYAAGDLSRCNLHGCGTVFQLSPQAPGWNITNLQTFGGGQNGANPAGALLMDAAGNLFGTTQLGGNTGACFGGCGTVFELSFTAGRWRETLLHAFTASGKDGYQPLGGLIFDSAGNLYGTTSLGGTNGAGIVYEVTP